MHQAHKVVEALGRASNESSIQQLMDDLSFSDAENDANWQQVVAYTHTVSLQNVHQHVPFTSYFLSQTMAEMDGNNVPVADYPSAQVMG